MISFFLEQFTSPLYLWLFYHRIPLNGAPILPAEGNALILHCMLHGQTENLTCWALAKILTTLFSQRAQK